jgi:hypothetical protein
MRPNGEDTKYIARLVARTFIHKPGINFNETHLPLARLKTVISFVAITNHMCWFMY